MAATLSNWVHEKGLSTETDKKNLEKAHRYETAMIKAGYRWFTVNSRTKILVECDKDGNPTKRGQKQIEQTKANCGTMK